MEEPASVAPNRCKTSLAPIYGLQSESSLALYLPLSLRYGLSLRTRIWLCPSSWKTTPSSGFSLFPSFPDPYIVPPGLASITLDKVSELRKRSLSLSHSQVSSLETMLPSVCEVTSWLDWWLFTCWGFQEHLPDEVRGNFERLMLSGSRALEFLGNQGVTALGNLMLSHRDAVLLAARSMVPAEEVAHLCYADLPSSLEFFPLPCLTLP